MTLLLVEFADSVWPLEEEDLRRKAKAQTPWGLTSPLTEFSHPLGPEGSEMPAP